MIAPLVLACVAPSGALGDELITFELDALGPVPNGFMSVDSSHVSFTDTVGAGLQVANAFETNNTNGLAVFDDLDGSELEMIFDCLVTTLSLDFGNDDPGFTNPGDLAVLKTYVGATQVGLSTVVLNRDDMMNQTITSLGLPFNRAIFAYTDPAGVPMTGGGGANVGLIEAVDNIEFTCVPEPATLWLLTFGLIGGGLFRSRGRQRGN
jgi:hypothetical protein